MDENKKGLHGQESEEYGDLSSFYPMLPLHPADLPIVANLVKGIQDDTIRLLTDPQENFMGGGLLLPLTPFLLDWPTASEPISTGVLEEGEPLGLLELMKKRGITTFFTSGFDGIWQDHALPKPEPEEEPGSVSTKRRPKPRYEGGLSAGPKDVLKEIPPRKPKPRMKRINR
jgi:hypothetical protein